MEFRERMFKDAGAKEDAMSDDEDNKIEIIEGNPENMYEMPTMKPLNDKQGVEDVERLYDSFALPDSDGFSLDFIHKVRTNDHIRRNYMSKLTYQKVWLTPLQQPKLHETAIIFDWDDTLLCTSYINPSGYYRPTDLHPSVLN